MTIEQTLRNKIDHLRWKNRALNKQIINLVQKLKPTVPIVKDPSKSYRSLTKAISWEIISLVLTSCIAYPFFGTIGKSISLAMICFVVKVVFYYLHERLWHQIPFGKEV